MEWETTKNNISPNCKLNLENCSLNRDSVEYLIFKEYEKLLLYWEARR